MSTSKDVKNKKKPSKTVQPPKREKKCKFMKLKLHQLLDETEITELHELFDMKEGRRMDRDELMEVLDEYASVKYDTKTYETMFRQMNTACDGYVTWNEFISYLILGFQEQEIGLEYKTLDAPIPTSPLMMKSNHRHRVNRIAFYPTVKLDRTCNWHDGSIITCSQDGVVNYWSLDMQLERSAQSTCPLLKVQTTWVTDMAVLPDVSVICTSSSERDLRFYDTSARKFELRVMITSLPDAVTTMYYKFDTDINVPSKLIMGDMGGSIRVIQFQSEARGPFKSQPGIPLLCVRYESVLKHAIPNLTIIEFPYVHTDFIRQVSYFSSMHCLISCSQSNKALIMTDISDSQKNYVYKIFAGAWCFAMEENAHMIATGGPDCLVRVWNPFIPRRATCTFYGHHTGVVQLVFQDNGKRLYSLSKDKCIKVWDIGMQALVQTYLELPAQLGDSSEITSLYNPESRQWIVGSNMIAVLSLSPNPSSEHTDGNTHIGGVSVVLYNKLYKKLVTCGLDSFIIVWNPFDGRRLLIIREAHTVLVHGAIKPVEITAATFDPGYQRLLTGAHDGTLKIWSFNSGTCLRNMKTWKWSEIKSVIWVNNRIMATGWNRRIIEFADTGEAVGPGGAYSKNWDLRHTEDISAAAVRVPETVATSSYAGELILWRLETGQPYKKFNVSNPTARIKIHYQLAKTEKTVKEEFIHHKRKSMAAVVSSIYKDNKRFSHQIRRQDKRRKVSTVAVPDECFHLRKLAVHCMLFLNARKSDPDVGTLLIALENGVVQVWNHHVQGSFITSFSVIHKAGDYVISMTSDEKNEFLFTGTTVGYIKTWLLKNFCVSPADEEHIYMPKYRLMFPFMWGNTFMGRAARMAADQAKPVLLNSFKGHFMPVSGLTYIDECQILLSCSADFSVRMWTLGGRYLQTIGTFKPWKTIREGKPVPPNFDFSIPPDIKKVASSTTLRVLSGGSFEKRLTIKQLQKRAEHNLVQVDQTKIYGKPLDAPLLGNYYTLPERTVNPKDITFDMSFPYIPVYQHLIMPGVEPIKISDEICLKQKTHSPSEDKS